MIIKRQKQFGGNLQDGFGGKKGDIKESKNPAIKRVSSSIQKFRNMTWSVSIGEEAQNDIDNLDGYFTEQDLRRIKEIMKWITKHPYSADDNRFEQHPLWIFEDNSNIDPGVVWSAKINDRDRLNYTIFKAEPQIVVLNCRGHFVSEIGYSLDKGKNRLEATGV